MIKVGLASMCLSLVHPGTSVRICVGLTQVIFWARFDYSLGLPWSGHNEDVTNLSRSWLCLLRRVHSTDFFVHKTFTLSTQRHTLWMSRKKEINTSGNTKRSSLNCRIIIIIIINPFWHGFWNSFMLYFSYWNISHLQGHIAPPSGACISDIFQ